VRGDVKEGQEVVIGTAATSQRTSGGTSSAQPPRLRF
jgi:hypothetical protein